MRRDQRAVLSAPPGHLRVCHGENGPPGELQAAMDQAWHVPRTRWCYSHGDRVENTHQVILHTSLPWTLNTSHR